MTQHHAVIGAQWGDEGKGKIVDFLAQKHQVVVRYQGGTNAGHTLVVDGQKFPLHLVPSGILTPNSLCVIGDGVIVQPLSLVSELSDIKSRVKKTAKLLLSQKAHLIMPWHEIRDGIAGGKIGTTGKGIGPTYTDATNRTGIRVIDLADKKRFKAMVEDGVIWNRLLIKALCGYHQLSPKATKDLLSDPKLNPDTIIKSYLKAYAKLQNLGVETADVTHELTKQIAAGKSVLYEGAQATLLDITHGDYPFVTSSHPTIGGIAIGTGQRPQNLTVIGVSKAYATRVGEGPFVTELHDKTGEYLRQKGNEFGTTTGRPRRCGWLDLVALNYSVTVNGLDQLAMTKLDILTGLKEIKVATAYTNKGKTITNYPVDAVIKQACKPVYKTFSGWSHDISMAKKWADLPSNAKKYIEFIEDQTKTKVKFIGVGPQRESTIVR